MATSLRPFRGWNIGALLVALILLALSPAARASNPSTNSLPNSKPTRIQVYPDKIDLTTSRDWKMVVVQAFYPDGVTADVTDRSKLAFDNAALVRLDGHLIYGAKDGQTQLTVSFGDLSAKVPVAVKQAGTDRLISFRNDVMPVITGSGCNTGGCHGSAAGKDGFHLSLFGYDPDGDYFNLTRQLAGRRINLAIPEESLMLQKATGAVQHTGGQRFTTDSQSYATVIRWLKAGAPKDPPDVAHVESVQIMPSQMVLTTAGTQQLVVIASYSDGSQRDITSLATISSNNDSSATIDKGGKVTAKDRGEAFIFARFNAFSVASQVIVVPTATPYVWPNTPENNYVDTLVDAKLKKLRILPSDLCTDSEFIRRAYIDVIGLVPSPADLDAFINDPTPSAQKREKLVDTLLGRKEFVELWVMKFAELLQIRSEDLGNGMGISYKSALLYYNWLQDQLGNNVPMDKIVRELLASSGSTFSDPATNYYQVERDTLKLTENVAQVFMGVQVKCAQCHNHPFDRWTLDDYYSFAAFFEQVGRKPAEDPRDTVVFNSGSGEAHHPIGGREMKPKFLGGAVPDLAGRDRREVVAEWLTSPDNPFFAKNLANIVWAHFFGKGIVNPVDDVRVTNPPSNPELAEELGHRFSSYHYDFRKLVRDICLSRTYQLSSHTNTSNAADERNFSHSLVRRMRAEVLFDVISAVTDTSGQNKFKGLPQGARAVQIADGRTSTYFLTTFGRASRDTVSSCEVKTEPTLSQALHLINGDTIQEKIRGGGVVKNALAAGKTPPQVVEDLYLRCLARKPTADELNKIGQQVQGEKDAGPVLEDVFWALLNSDEFVFNH